MNIFRRGLALVVVGVLLASACGSAEVVTGGELPVRDRRGAMQAVSVPDRSTSGGDVMLAGEAVSEFGNALFVEVRGATPLENVTLSPLSVAVALSMLEPGANGDSGAQLRELLRIEDRNAFHASMNALEQELEARVPRDLGSGGDPGEVTVRLANAAYLQEGYPFVDGYLEEIGTNYGSVLKEVDFVDRAGVAGEINRWISDETEALITDLLSEDSIPQDTVLALVNALYMNASWLEPFDEGRTSTDSFTLLNGSTVDVDMMRGEGDSSSSGDGWVGATKVYAGGLEIQFILPAEGRFEEIAADLPAVFASYGDRRSSGSRLEVPKYESETQVSLGGALEALGLTAPFGPGGLLGIADDPKLKVDSVLHATFVAMDEQGTEAAAATVILGVDTSAPEFGPVPVTLDRPFLYRIVDRTSGATLFISQIVDPNA